MAAEAPWRQLSPHNAGCYPDVVHQIMQRMWWEARIDHNHIAMCFLCNICSRVSGYHLVKMAMMELALWEKALHLGATNRVRKTSSHLTPGVQILIAMFKEMMWQSLWWETVLVTTAHYCDLTLERAQGICCKHIKVFVSLSRDVCQWSQFFLLFFPFNLGA